MSKISKAVNQQQTNCLPWDNDGRFLCDSHVSLWATLTLTLTLHICWQESLSPGEWGQRSSQVTILVLQFEGWEQKKKPHNIKTWLWVSAPWKATVSFVNHVALPLFFSMLLEPAGGVERRGGVVLICKGTTTSRISLAQSIRAEALSYLHAAGCPVVAVPPRTLLVNACSLRLRSRNRSLSLTLVFLFFFFNLFWATAQFLNWKNPNQKYYKMMPHNDNITS